MALYSFERYIAITYPLRIDQIFNKSRKISCVFTLLLSGFVIYLYIIIINVPEVRKIRSFCSLDNLDKHMMWIYKIFSRIESFFSVYLPFTIIITFNMCIVYKLRKSYMNCEISGQSIGMYQKCFFILVSDI